MRPVTLRPGWRATAGLALMTVAAAPATGPTTSPVAVPADCTVVRPSTLSLSFDADGVFEPVAPFKVRFALRQYDGSLVVRRAVADGATVAKGDLLLAIDTDPIDRQIAAAASAVEVARAGVTKAESDVALGEKADALAMDTAKQSAADAEAGLKRYDQTDAPNAVVAAGLPAKEVDAALDDATDELDQLRQMYKSEDLSNQTADIVLKRAVRQQDVYRTMDRVAKVLADRATTYEPAVRRHAMGAGVAAEAQSVDALAASQAVARVRRAAALTAARAAAADADRARAELDRDRAALTVTSPVDGVVVYGSFADKAWQPLAPDRLAADQKVQSNQTLMTVYQPGRLAVMTACGEARLRLMSPGTPVTVRAAVVPEASYAGTCGTTVDLPASARRDATVDVPVTLPAVDPRIVPGMFAAVEVDAPPAAGVLTVPATAVFHGRVCVRASDGTVAVRPVTLGQAVNGKDEVRAGLHDGDVVLTTYKD